MKKITFLPIAAVCATMLASCVSSSGGSSAGYVDSLARACVSTAKSGNVGFGFSSAGLEEKSSSNSSQEYYDGDVTNSKKIGLESSDDADYPTRVVIATEEGYGGDQNYCYVTVANVLLTKEEHLEQLDKLAGSMGVEMKRTLVASDGYWDVEYYGRNSEKRVSMEMQYSPSSSGWYFGVSVYKIDDE